MDKCFFVISLAGNFQAREEVKNSLCTHPCNWDVINSMQMPVSLNDKERGFLDKTRGALQKMGVWWKTDVCHLNLQIFTEWDNTNT